MSGEEKSIPEFDTDLIHAETMKDLADALKLKKTIDTRGYANNELTLDQPAREKAEKDVKTTKKTYDDISATFFDAKDKEKAEQGKGQGEQKPSFYERPNADNKLTKVGDKQMDAVQKLKVTLREEEGKLTKDLEHLLGKQSPNGEERGDKGDGKDNAAAPSKTPPVLITRDSESKKGSKGKLDDSKIPDLVKLDPKDPTPPGFGGFQFGGGFAGGGPNPGPGGMGGGMMGMGGFNPSPPGGGMAGVPNPLVVTPTLVPTSPGYYQPILPPPVAVKTESPNKKGSGGEGSQSKPGEDKKTAGEPKPPAEQPKVEPKDLVPESTNRKIIRTGDMEFEIESFDKSVDTINGLINNIKGAFIATVNSDKLPNGKMRGSVVVRMPPQNLDKFIFDLRRDLGKSGELKNQRIGSQDVTKSYTDIESRLRAARAIEERLINIIKTGKGEIKDLVAAERELGVWRTKIEEMEGEIRYYNNQVSLSTLTISLAEKEIQTPTAIVVTETVTLRLEVDDVAKSHQIAMKAIDELKGRITRSELKQHAAGQFLSVLHAEIPPSQKDSFVDQLKKLGLVSDFQENQRQHTEGGTGKAPSLKPKQNDVCFEITMHNTANIRPRLSADLKIATTDVPGAYAKLLAAITKAKGQVRDAKLNEQDKLNIHGLIDFNVPTSEKAAIDKLLEEIGPTLERINVQAPLSELSTERKFGYTIVLRDFASIPPKQAVIDVIAANDVPGAYTKLQDAIAKAKGQITAANLNEKDKLNIFAKIEFTVPSEEKKAIEKLLEEIGTLLSRDKFEAPLNQLSTAKKFGFALTLRDFASVPPRQAVVQIVATFDVAGNLAKLQDAILKAKGLVADAKLNEQDKLNITAQIDFTVPSEERKAFEKLLEDFGTVVSRNNIQTPANVLATTKKFGFSLTLRDFASIPPSKAVAQIVATLDVAGSLTKLQDAILKAKGQISDTKLNEQDKLNITAQIDFTIPSEERKAFESLLETLGTVVSRNNVQTPANVLSTAKKFGFSLLLRDVASIPPSKAADLKVATNDVPASYAKLLDAITKAKGQLVDAKLNENDKFNITAQIDFSVPTDEKATIKKMLADFGTILARNNVQMPMSQLSIAKKFGFSVTLRDFANILPSHAADIKLAATDVPNNYAMLVEAVVKAKGQIRVAKLNEQDKLNITAHLDFSVPTTEKNGIDKLLLQIGPMLSRNNVQAPVNELTTERKFGYSVVLRDFAAIPPRETFHVQIAAIDVSAGFKELQDAVTAAKGLVTVGQLTEDSKIKIEAKFEFDVPAAERHAVEKLFSKVGVVLGRTSGQIPVNDQATDQKVGYRLTIRSTATIPPRETVVVKLEVKDVDGRAS